MKIGVAAILAVLLLGTVPKPIVPREPPAPCRMKPIPVAICQRGWR